MKKTNLFNLCAFLFFLVLNGNTASAQTTPSAKHLPDDVKLPVTNASASTAQQGEDIARSYDGNLTTLYHSPYSDTSFPVTLTYNFAGAGVDMDYVRYITRQDGSNGNFKLVEIQKKSVGETAYTKVVELDLGGAGGARNILFLATQKAVVSIRIIVKSGQGGWASCAEMEFYKKNTSDFDLATIFADQTCSALQAGVTRAQLENVKNPYYKELALQLFDQNYPAEFRVQEYKAWPHPDDFSNKNRVGTYSLCDNPTGIFAQTGDTVVVFVGNTDGYSIGLRYQNLNRPGGDGFYNAQYFALSEGLNKIKVGNPGLFYVMYHTPNHLTAPKIKVHFSFGRENGYYDTQKHTAEDWTRLLNATQYEYLDVLGSYAHLTFPTANFKKNAAANGRQLIQNYDDLVYAQREFMGYFKYPNRNPYNRSYFCVIYTSYMYSAGYHTAYEVGNMDGLTTAANVRRYPWGPAHEVGHSNQHSPLLKWVGTTEVTNNIQSLYVQTLWGNPSRMTEENRYHNALNNLLAPKISHCEADIWEKLIPMWQLQLFFGNVLGRKDFYASVYEAARTWPNLSWNHGLVQLNYPKMVCDSAKMDLTEFFEDWGFFKPVNKQVEDYTPAQVTITTTQSNATKAYIKNKNYETPKYKIQYITDTNWQIYKNKSNVVQGTATVAGSAITAVNWKNVVAYEGYRGDQLICVSVANKIDFAGRFDNSCAVYAVQYDGEKFLVTRGSGLPIPIEAPKVSDAQNEYWYYIKNMSNTATNSQGGTPRSFCSLKATASGAGLVGTSEPVFATQKWKLVQAGTGKMAVVNQNGLYMGQNLTAVTTPYGWNIERVTQQGSEGYRFKTMRPKANDATKTEECVPHLDLMLKIINYTSSDEASVWQFIPAETIKMSNDANTYWYQVQTLRPEDAYVGAYLTGDNTNNTISQSKESTQKWKIVSSGAGTALANEDGKYLTINGTTPALSETPRVFYVYLATAEGTVGCRLASATSPTASMLNLSSTGTVNLASSVSTSALWLLAPKFGTDISLLQANSKNYKIYAVNRRVVVENVTDFNVYTVSGKKVTNENLNEGVYIVSGKDFTAKVIVR